MSRRINRRDFVRQSAVLGAPFFLPAGVLAGQGRPGANDRIAVGAIGVGRRGAGILGNKELRIVAVADVNLPRAREVAGRFKADVFQDYRKLLERKDIDAIITATPDHWHALVAIHACQAGKDVYAEKPLSLTIREGRLMVEAARKYNRIFQTGTQRRSFLGFKLACELVRGGKLGKIHTVQGLSYPGPWECNFPGQPVPDGLDWDMWCGPAPLVPYHNDLYRPRATPGWMAFRAYSGGELANNGSHFLDLVQWALGADDTGPVEIWTEGDKFNPPTYTKPESGGRGLAACNKPDVFFRYASGAIVKLDTRTGNGGPIFLADKVRLTIHDRGIVSDPPELAQEILQKADQAELKRDNHMQNWVDCLRSRRRPAADVEIGHRSATVCHLGNIARWLGRRLRWDPAKEVFPGDQEANTYLDRPRRKPYQLPDRV